MNNDFNDFNNNNESDEINSEDVSDEKVSPKTVSKIRRLFFTLLSIGLAIGIIMAFAVVKVLNKFGLTDKTPQFERQIQK